MSYVKNTWQDKFIDPVTGDVTNGTGITAARMNNLEQGVYDAHVVFEQHALDIANLKNRVGLIESTFPDNFKNNLFTDDLVNIDDIILTRGYYNEAQTRLEV